MNQEANFSADLERVPGFMDSLRFFISSRLRILLRWGEDYLSPIKRLEKRSGGSFDYVSFESVSDIFSQNLAETEFLKGKLRNLEIACRSIDGYVLPAGEIFSFWKQVGRPVVERGFVVGREIRSGCIIPAVGGGLCQLSGALYEVSLRSGLQITESHPHSRRLPGMPYVAERDATVFWNYVDLRFQSEFTVLFECKIEDDQLKVRLRGAQAFRHTLPSSLPVAERKAASDCLSCGKVACANHLSTQQTVLGRLWLSQSDLTLAKKFGVSYSVSRGLKVSHLLERLLQTILFKFDVPVGRVAMLRARVAATFCRFTYQNQQELFLSQSVLPFLQPWLEKRKISYSVFASHLDLKELQVRLDVLSKIHPEDFLLSEFRVDSDWIEREAAGLRNAKQMWVTHPELKQLYPGAKYIGPQKVMPHVAKRKTDTLIFPGPLAGREGVHEVVEAARILKMRLVSFHPSARLGKFPIEYLSLEEVRQLKSGIVVHPTVYETPHSVLRDLYELFPIIGSSGLPLPRGSYQQVPLADVPALISSVRAFMDEESSKKS